MRNFTHYVLLGGIAILWLAGTFSEAGAAPLLPATTCADDHAEHYRSGEKSADITALLFRGELTSPAATSDADEFMLAFTYFPRDWQLFCDEDTDIDFGTPEVGGACSDVHLIVTVRIVPGTCPAAYVMERTWTATDDCGSISRIQRITVSDTEAPVLTPVGRFEGLEDGDTLYAECADWRDYLGTQWDVIADDNCDDEVTISFSYDFAPFYDCTTRGLAACLHQVWTATDDCGNSTTFSLRYFFTDNTPPVISGVPDDVCMQPGSTLPPVPEVTAVDECSPEVQLMFSESEPEPCDGGMRIVRTWMATDNCGNKATATQNIVMNDRQGPTIRINYPGVEGLPHLGEATLVANCELTEDDIPYLISLAEVTDGCSEASFVGYHIDWLAHGHCPDTDFLYRIKLTLKAMDACGNATEYSLFLTIVDGTAPVFENNVSTLVLQCGDTIPTPFVHDYCHTDFELTFEDVQQPGNYCPDSATPLVRRWTATDACGNSSTFEQRIFFINDSRPVLMGIPEDLCGTAGLPAAVSALDPCTGGTLQPVFTETTEASPCGPVTLRTWTVTDACGRTTSATQRIYPLDNEAPQIFPTHPLIKSAMPTMSTTVACDALPGSDPFRPDFGPGAVTVLDNCGQDIEATLSVTLLETPVCAVAGYIARLRYTWTATDPCGNTSTLSIIVLVVDRTPPVLTNIPYDDIVFCADALPAPAAVRATDACSEVEVMLSVRTQPIFGGYILFRTWRATDLCGNSASATQRITVLEDNLDCSFWPIGVIECESAGNQLKVVASGGEAPYTFRWEQVSGDGAITAGWNSDIVTFETGTSPIGLSVTVTDAGGCEHVCTTIVECEDDLGGGVPEGVAAAPITADILLFPNPLTRDELSINLGHIGGLPGRIDLFDLQGRQVYHRDHDELPVGNFTLDLGHLPVGAYYLRVIADGQAPITKALTIMRN